MLYENQFGFFDFFSVNANNAGTYGQCVCMSCMLVHFLTCNQYGEYFNIVGEITEGFQQINITIYYIISYTLLLIFEFSFLT